MANCITSAEVVSQCRLNSEQATADSTLITHLINTAETWAQLYRSEKFITTTCVDYYDYGFPTVIEPLYSPLISVTSIHYVDTSGDTQTLDSSVYTVDTHQTIGAGRIVQAYSQTWPSTRSVINAVTVTTTAGYGTVSTDVPDHIRQGVLLLVAHLYENREALSVVQLHQVPFGVLAMLGIDRRIPL